MAGRQPAPRHHQAGVAVRDGDGHPGGHHGAAAPAGQCRRRWWRSGRRRHHPPGRSRGRAARGRAAGGARAASPDITRTGASLPPPRPAGSMPAHAGLDRSRNDGTRSGAPHHRRDRLPHHRRQPRTGRGGPRPGGARLARAAGEHGRLRPHHAHPLGSPDRHGGVDADPGRRRGPDPGLPPVAHSRGPHGPPGRELHRDGPPLPGRSAARDRGLPQLPLGRRLHHQGALPALAPRRLQGRTPEVGRPPGPAGHPRVRGRAGLLPRRRSSTAPPTSEKEHT